MRNSKIDFLRFIGLSMIIFAHVGPPAFFFQIRNFDVPLMVLVSGMSFGLAFKKEAYFSYLWKRVKRLIFPVWVFLTIFFISIYLVNPSANDLSLYTILTSYFLVSGIGYVWIIRVFILVALIAPIIYSVSNNTKSDSVFLIKLISIYVLYEMARYFYLPYTEDGIGKLFSLIFFYMIPYSIIFALGLRITVIQEKLNLNLFFYFTFIFLGLATYLWVTTGDFIPTQHYKYPPSIYYFSYAIAVSMLLWIVGDKVWKIIEFSPLASRVILFVAQNSIWVYLWHIPVVKVIHVNFFLKYFIVFSVAICITFMQVWVVRNILIPSISSNRIKNNIKMVLTG